MMRLAKISDLEKIMDVIGNVVKEMNFQGNYQWDSNYPKENDFLQDIKKEELYLYEVNGHILGLVCINFVEAEEYRNLIWSSNEKAMIIHRMAVGVNSRRQGIASKIINFVEALAKKNQIYYLRTDTFSLNEKMKNLFLKEGYKFIGKVNFRGKEEDFSCYDKVLSTNI